MMNLYIGLMSGTSMDGIDAALVNIDNNQLILGMTHAYSENVLQFLHELSDQKNPSLSALYELNAMIGREFAAAANQLRVSADVDKNQIIAIGSHGQTVRHEPKSNFAYTVQLGCGHTIAELTGLTVVADFRTRDLINGGQGAPLAPIYHQELFKTFNHPLAVVNIGGIANVSFINDQGFATSGYDTGPGNCLMDKWVKKHLGNDYDKNGEWAKTGSSISRLLEAMLGDPYFERKPPKSLGKEYFSDLWLETYLTEPHKHEDVQATLLALTAKTISDEIRRHPLNPQTVILCGGGAHNQALREELCNLLPKRQIATTDVIGVNPDHVEAMMMAWLAHKTITRTPLDLSQITGAAKSAILGVIYPPGIDKINSLAV
ncbi:anhydro-N-acetylmuramic acid kinase [Legionella londiniensis]|uniref:Anhydro-N-acetylmuramic acid kinase n=2 Tax=Legionella londiniensis TaxID=45068 RepID=A0A0W0VKK1_9GAMM|nr:anhydro-N-acetylmuramic acid kinase [Legionella londiniensis]STX92905.1 anhydro-N-acetylmuramic acid kinase [Legionella londiniensis]